MTLTPLEIKKQEFKKNLRGYDPVEVDAFLELVSEELEDIIRDKNELADEVLILKTQLRDYKSVEKTLQDTLMSAQESIKDSKENSNREADIIVREAELKAEQILEHTKLRLAEMKNELVLVKSQKDSFARRLRHLLDSQLELIQVLELDDLGFGPYESSKKKTGMRHHRKSSGSETEQEKIEFAAVDDVLPERPAERQSADDGKNESAHDIHWGKRNLPEDIPDSSGDEQKPAQRISDQLIT